MAATLWESSSANAVQTTLNGTINDSVTTVTLTSVSNLVAPGVIVIDRQDGSGNNTPSKREYISFTGVSGSDLTGVVRGRGGSTAQSHSSGALVEAVLTADHWTDLVDFLQVEHDAAGKHVISTATITYTETQRIATTSIASIARIESQRFVAASLASFSLLQAQDMVIGGNASIGRAFIGTHLNVSSASISGIFTSGASGSVLTSIGANLLPVFAAAVGGGDMSYANTRFYIGSFTRDQTAASGNVAYTGVGFVPGALLIIAVIDQTVEVSFGFAVGTAEQTIGSYGNNKFTNSGGRIVFIDTGAGVGQSAVVASMDADGFTLTWTKNGTPGSGTITAYYLAFK